MNSIEHIYSHFLRSTGITTDTRQCKEGMIFVALRGENFDGNHYAQAALEEGCSYVIIDNPAAAGLTEKLSDKILIVEDSLHTLQQLARHHRRALGLPVIGITGTNGKTTTKELIAAVLSRKYRIHYTQGNLNNHIGVPLTLLQLTSEHEMAVIEMGASHPGDIKELTEIAEPNYGLITNVGIAHLQGFGSFEGVVRTKREMYDYLLTTPHRTIFLNADNHYLRTISEGLNPVTYGQSEELDICGQVIDCAPYLRLQWKKRHSEWHEVTTRLIGSYNIDNILCAAAVGTHFGVAEEEISVALTEYTPSNNRSQLAQTKSNTLIVDAYNANPTSMRAAIDNFAIMEAPHKMLILGDMKELGEATATAHQEIVDRLNECHFDEVWLVGPAFSEVKHSQRTFANTEEVKIALQKSRPEGYHILIKGSNSMRLSSLIEML